MIEKLDPKILQDHDTGSHLFDKLNEVIEAVNRIESRQQQDQGSIIEVPNIADCAAPALSVPDYVVPWKDVERELQDRYPAFLVWMRGQTHHADGVYRWDLETFNAGGPILD